MHIILKRIWKRQRGRKVGHLRNRSCLLETSWHHSFSLSPGMLCPCSLGLWIESFDCQNWSKNLMSLCKTSGSAVLVKLRSEIQASSEGPHKGMKGLGSSWVQLHGCPGYIWVAASGRILPKLSTCADSGTHQGGLFSYLLHEVKACANALT